MPDKIPIKEQRDAQLRNLRLQAGQDSAWKTQMVELVEELNRDTLKLRIAYGKVLVEVQSLKTQAANQAIV